MIETASGPISRDLHYLFFIRRPRHTDVTETTASEAENSFRMLPVLTMLIGAMIVGVGILLLPESRLGGAHIVAIGLSLFCSGLVVTRWAADRFTLRSTDQRRWSMAFAVLAGILLVLFVSINWMTFGEGQFGSEDFEEVG